MYIKMYYNKRMKVWIGIKATENGK